MLLFIDIDECAIGTHDCHRDSNATCNDTDGSFTCTCREGFDGNGTFCAGTIYYLFSVNIETLSVDIDQCINATTCDANAECNNTYGSFFCTCNAGYEGNGFTCTGRDWIVMGARSIIMSMDCSCSDVDECAMDVDNCDPTNGVCTNTEGSFICTCTIGYSGDGINCSSEWHHGFHKVFWGIHAGILKASDAHTVSLVLVVVFFVCV